MKLFQRASCTLAIVACLQGSCLFGMQSVPKFDERLGEGGWGGTRERGMRMHRDLGVELSREGMIWMNYEPRPETCPWQDDFDDAVNRLNGAHIAIEEMITDTPFWASSHPHKEPSNPSSFKNAPPMGLSEPIFQDGSDEFSPGKKINRGNPWAVFLERMAKRYRGKIKFYQVWNEPDFPSGAEDLDFSKPERTWQGSVGQYVRLLKVAHTVIKGVDPGALIVTGGLGYPRYLEAILERGGGDYFDCLDFHAYGFPGSDTGIKEFLKVHGMMKRTLHRYGMDRKKLLCSETGYSSLEPKEQADFITKLYTLSSFLGLLGTCYYSNTNPSWKEMGLVDWKTLSQRTEGYEAYRKMSATLKEARFVRKLPVRPEIAAYLFEKRGGKILIAWAPYREEQEALPWKPAGKWRSIDSPEKGEGKVLKIWKRPAILEEIQGQQKVERVL